jgi:hypothetical protein
VFGTGERSGPMMGQIVPPGREAIKSSLIVLAIALHVFAAIILAAILVWKLS